MNFRDYDPSTFDPRPNLTPDDRPSGEYGLEYIHPDHSVSAGDTCPGCGMTAVGPISRPACEGCLELREQLVNNTSLTDYERK